MIRTGKNYDYHFKILLIGDSSVGKSSLLIRFSENTFDSRFIATIGVDFKDKVVQVGNDAIKLQIWDTAGQERFRTITSTYYRGASGVIVVYDVTDPKSFVSVTKWMAEAKANVGGSIAVMLVGNKCDLEDTRIVSKVDGKKLADEHQAIFLESSAKDNTNVDNIFYEMATKIRDTRSVQDRPSSGGIELSSSRRKAKKKSSCC